MNFIEELRWRGMIHDIMPGTEEALLENSSSGYIGFDPTSDSLHIGSLVQIMILKKLPWLTLPLLRQLGANNVHQLRVACGIRSRRQMAT